jgi:hypothetical protein
LAFPSPTITKQKQPHNSESFSSAMSFINPTHPLATAAAAPGLFTQIGMAGTAAVITVSFIHPIDVIKVCLKSFLFFSVEKPKAGTQFE